MNKIDKQCTIIFPAKNDNYNRYFLNRLNYVLEHTANLIRELNVEYFFELNVVDWGSQNKISDNLLISHKNKNLISFFEVSEDIAISESKKKYGYFNQPKVINVSIRRTESEYILFTSHDLIFSKQSLLNLYNYLNYKIVSKKIVDNTFVNIQRYFLPKDLTINTPTFNFLNYWLTNYSFLNGDIGVTTGSAFAGHLTSKKIWKSIRGINEKFEGYGFMDPDLHSRVNMLASYCISNRFGFHMYKIDRGSNNKRTAVLKNMNKNWTSLNFEGNEENWGIVDNKINKKFLEKVTSFDETTLKLGEHKNLYFSLKDFFSIFLVPVKLRIPFISINEIKIYLSFLEHVKTSDSRLFLFLGYEKPFIPLFLLKLIQSSNIIIYDNLKKIVLENKKLKALNERNLLEGLNFKRASMLGEAKTINCSDLINHQGYFQSVNSLDRHQILNLFKNVNYEKKQIFITIYENQISDLKLLSSQIDDNVDYINGLFVISYSKQFYLLNYLKKNNFSINKLSNNIIFLSNTKISQPNKYLFLYNLFLINSVLLISNIKRLFYALARRLVKLFTIKNYKDLGG